MTRDEIVLVVREIHFGPAQNAVLAPLLERLHEALPHSEISDLIFHDFRGSRLSRLSTKRCVERRNTLRVIRASQSEVESGGRD